MSVESSMDIPGAEQKTVFKTGEIVYDKKTTWSYRVRGITPEGKVSAVRERTEGDVGIAHESQNAEGASDNIRVEERPTSLEALKAKATGRINSLPEPDADLGEKLFDPGELEKTSNAGDIHWDTELSVENIREEQVRNPEGIHRIDPATLEKLRAEALKAMENPSDDKG